MRQIKEIGIRTSEPRAIGLEDGKLKVYIEFHQCVFLVLELEDEMRV